MLISKSRTTRLGVTLLNFVDLEAVDLEGVVSEGVDSEGMGFSFSGWDWVMTGVDDGLLDCAELVA